jgi:hypothetical protein
MFTFLGVRPPQLVLLMDCVNSTSITRNRPFETVTSKSKENSPIELQTGSATLGSAIRGPESIARSCLVLTLLLTFGEEAVCLLTGVLTRSV